MAAKTGAERVAAFRQRQLDRIAELEAEVEAHTACVSLADLAEDVKESPGMPVEALRNVVRMYVKTATRRSSRSEQAEHVEALKERHRVEVEELKERVREVSRRNDALSARVNSLERSVTNRAKRNAAKLEQTILEG